MVTPSPRAPERVPPTRWLRAAPLGLGLGWTLLALAKLGDPERAAYLSGRFGDEWAVPASWVILSLEALLAAGLLLGGPAVARWACRGSVLLLVAFGTSAALHPESACRCAGQLGVLKGEERLLLVAFLLSLAGAGLLLPNEGATTAPAARASWRGPRGLRVALAATALAALAALMALVLSRPSNDATAPGVEAVVRGDAVISRPRLQAGRRAAASDPARDPSAVGAARTAVAPVEGRVVAARTGQGVAGARVWFATARPPVQRVGSIAMSTEEGAFELHVPDDPERTRLIVCAPGHRVWSEAWLSLSQRDGVVEVRLPGGRSMRGRVVDDGGLGIPGVRVQARGPHGEDAGWATEPEGWTARQMPDLAEVLSDRDGRFTLDGLGDAEYEVCAYKRGFAQPQDGREQPLRLHVPASGVEDLVLTLRPLFEARLVVLDADSGDPIRGASITTSLVSGRPWAYAYAGRPAATRGGLEGEPFSEGSGGATLVAVGTESLETPVTFKVRALGYPYTQVDAVPAPFGARQPVVVRLRGQGVSSLVPVRLRVVLPGGLAGPSATFHCAFGRGASWTASPTLRVEFQHGTATDAIHVPVGDYQLWLLPGSASVSLLPSGGPGRLGPFAVQVRDGPPVVVDLPCRIAPVCVRPCLEGGEPLAAYTLFVDGDGGSRQSHTWNGTPEELCQDPEGSGPGRVYWLPLGPCVLGVGKRGYEPVTQSLVIGSEEPLLPWAPILRPLPGR